MASLRYIYFCLLAVCITDGYRPAFRFCLQTSRIFGLNPQLRKTGLNAEEKSSSYFLERANRKETAAIHNKLKKSIEHDLLSAEDEIRLTKEYKLASNINKQTSLMRADLGREVTFDELGAIYNVAGDRLKFLRNRGMAARQKLADSNIRLVIHLTKFYRGRGVSYNDLIHEGMFGLAKAIEKFDPDRGFRFSTYSSWWIKQTMSKAVAEKSRTVRLPTHIHELVSNIIRAEYALTDSKGRKPSTAQLSEYLNVPIDKIELAIRVKQAVVSSAEEEKFQNDQGSKAKLVGDSLVSDIGDVALSCSESVAEVLRQEIRAALEKIDLTLREKQVVELRFGLTSNGNDLTLDEAGKHLLITRERVRQLESSALTKIHQQNTGLSNKLFDLLQLIAEGKLSLKASEELSLSK